MKKMRMMIALALAVVMLLCMTGCGQDKTPESLEDLIQLVDELNNEIEDLKERVAVLEQKGGLTKWELTPEVWSSNNGATISLSATPENYQAGQTAVFSVRLGDVEVANVVCAWDGKVYTAEVDLEAADGYSYFCTLVSPDGTREMIALNTVERTTDESLVYLQTSLHVYGNIVVESWEQSEKQLTIQTGFVQVQLPRLGNAVDVDMTKAELVFDLNGETLERRTLSLPEGEGENSYEMVLENLTFELPKLEDDYQLDLWLEVALSSEETLVVSGGSWYYNGGQLNMMVG